MKGRNFFKGFISVIVVATLAACATTSSDAPTQAKIFDEVESQATVAGIDKANRELTLRRSDGSYVEIVAGPEVRNFDQIAVGNTVTTRYVVSLSARRLDPSEPDTEPTAGVITARAQPGQDPAGGIGAGVAMTVVVRSVDQDQNIVTFTGPDGILHAVEAERDEGKAFVRGLKPGDRVEIIYEEVLAMTVM